MNKNEQCIIKIEDMSLNGEGIGKFEGYTLFVKDAIVGDLVRVRVIKAKKNYGYGRLEEILEPSPYRVEPVCPHHRRCGGCQLQAMSYEKQLEWKTNKVKNTLERIGGLKDVPMKEIIGMEEPYRYRNKAQYPVGWAKADREKRSRSGDRQQADGEKGKCAVAGGMIVAGFYAGRTHVIIDTEECYLGMPVQRDILRIVKAYMREQQVPPYEEATGKGLVRHVLIRTGFHTGEIMVCLVVNGEKLPKEELLVRKLRAITGVASIMLNVNREKTNVILGTKLRTLWGKDRITDKIGDVEFSISPLSFFQVNPVQTEKLYGKALEYAGDNLGEAVVWDLYCGIGTISLFLAQKAKQVYGVEIVPEAIEDARRNAAVNGMDNVEFFVGKAEEVVPQKYAEEGLLADVIVVDPPRKGCDEALLETIVKVAPKRVVYVSCDPATLARDLKYLVDNGYEVREVTPVDMFPMTVHVETVVLLSQRKPDDCVEVELELDEFDVTSAESKATYAEIKDYVLKEHGLKVSNLYISQVKRKCGIEVGENLRDATRRIDCLQDNSTTAANLEKLVSQGLPKSEESKQPQCPVEKEKAIKDALEHFGMV